MKQRGKGIPLTACEFSKYRDLPMTADLARILWDYEPLAGTLRWKGNAHYRHARKGDIAGTIDGHGYRIVTFYGKKFKTSRLAFLIMTGAWPPELAEHKNTIRSDDRWINLRPANQGQNLGNARTRSDNKLGVKGVSQGPDGKYYAYICAKGKRKNLGGFCSIELAKSAYDTAAKEWHGEFARSA